MTQHHQSHRRLGSQLFLGLALTGALGTFGLSPELQRQAVAQSWPSFGKSKAEKADAATAKASPSKSTSAARDEQIIRMNFVASTWEDVLKGVAKDAGATLVMDKAPNGRFSRTDFRKHSKTDALRILNQELEKQDFRVVEQGNFLVCLYLPTTRPEYRRSQIEPEGEARNETASSDDVKIPAKNYANSIQRTGGQAEVATSNAGRAKPATSGVAPRRDGALRTAAFQDSDQAGAQVSAVKPYQPKQKSARDLSKQLFDAFRERAEVIDNGPGGLPAVRIYGNPSPDDKNAVRKVLFTIGVDTDGNVLQVEGTGEQTDRIVRLLQRLDAAPGQAQETTRLISTKKGATAVAKNVQAAVTRLVAQNDQKGDAPEDAKTQTNRKDENGNPLPNQIGGIRSDVNVEAMEDIGVLILKGNQADVDAVLAIIKQIEELSAASAPDVHLQTLKNIDSEALADLLTTVYDKLKDAQGKKTDQTTSISVVAVVRPNAVLVLAAPRDLDSVIKLIKELDRPLAPSTAFATFTLKYAIAGQMEEMLKEFFDRQGNQNKGLATRVRIVADVRTNTVVVLAQPNDLKAIADLIPQLDKNESGAVSRVEMFPLKHAVADQLQQTVNLILQSVLNPAQLGQGQLGQAVLGIGGGNSSTQLRDVRSAILEYLTQDGPNGQKLRSGILADIRINSDDRSNTLIVTAPEESLDLVRELVKRLDRPATNVAEVKHFQLRNADASSVVTLLNQLFNGQTNQSQGGNNQNNQAAPGVQLAAAENASSVVPLRFSVDARSNSIVALGTSEALDIVDALIVRLDAVDIRERKTRVIALKIGPDRQMDPSLRQNTNAQAGLSTQGQLSTQSQLANEHPIVVAINNFLQTELSVLQTTGNASQGSQLSNNDRLERQAIIQWEPITNSVLVSAGPRYFDQIVKMIETLDAELPQVVIQAMLVEVTLENTDEFGVELGVQDSLLFSRGAVLPGSATAASSLIPGFNFNDTNSGLPNANASGQEHLAGQGLSNFGLGRKGTQGYGGLVLSAGSESINVMLRALAQNRKLEVLSRPQIRTLHNQRGSIRVAKQVPVIDGFTSNGFGTNSPIVGYRDAGITLEVIPKVGPDGRIQLQVAAQKTTVDPNGIQLQAATATTGALTGTVIDGTVAQAVLTVGDQETVVLGGLITKSTDKEERKVPWLGDLPIVGAAFRYDKLAQQRKELLIFLTPRVVRDPIESEAMKVIESARLHWTECEAEMIHGPIFGLPPEQISPIVEPSRFDSLSQPVAPAPTTPVSPSNPPPAPAADGSPMTRRSLKDSGVRQVSHDEPAKGKSRTR